MIDYQTQNRLDNYPPMHSATPEELYRRLEVLDGETTQGRVHCVPYEIAEPIKVGLLDLIACE